MRTICCDSTDFDCSSRHFAYLLEDNMEASSSAFLARSLGFTIFSEIIAYGTVS